MNAKNGMLVGILMAVVFMSGCLIQREPQVRSVVYAPPLPSIVVFETEPYYVQQGYHYHYEHDRWYYSRSRSGPWTILPRDRYPREVRYRDDRHGHNVGPGLQVVIAPPLPPLVVFEAEPYYVQQGYHYHYQNNGWYYSRSRSGPWTSLPRDRYPREVRYKDGRHGDDRGRGPQFTIPVPEHRERNQPPQGYKAPAIPQPQPPVKIQPPQPTKPVLPPPPVKVQPPPARKTSVLPPEKSPEVPNPPKEIKSIGKPSEKHMKSTQKKKLEQQEDKDKKEKDKEKDKKEKEEEKKRGSDQ